MAPAAGETGGAGVAEGETETGGGATWLATPPDPSALQDPASSASPAAPDRLGEPEQRVASGQPDWPDDPGEQNQPGRPDHLGGPEQEGTPGARDRAADSKQKRSRESADLDADPEAVARQVCLRMLTAAPRTRAQLAAALCRRGVPDEAAEAVLERFAEVQLIDDAMFARAWVESRHHGRGLARRALAAELRQRGVEAGDIQAAVAGLDPDQEAATARALVQRRVAGTHGLPRPARFRRLMGMLARKGYSESLAYRVVREALDAEPVGADPDDLPEPEPDDDQEQW